MKGSGGTPIRWRMGCQYTADGETKFRLKFDGVQFLYKTYVPTVSNLETEVSSWLTCNRTWGQISAGFFDVYLYALGTSYWVPQGVCLSACSGINIHTVWLEIEASPASSPATGVSIIGNSSADIVIGGKVSADIDGQSDDDSGTYTGVANALIERPDHICKHIIIDKCGKTSDEIDSASYDASNAEYIKIANDFNLGFALLKKPNVRELINRVAYQSRSMEYWEAGVHHLVYIPDSYSTWDKVIDSNRIDLNQIWLSYTPRIEVKNTLSAFYHRDWSGHEDQEESLRAVVKDSDATSIVDYGILQGAQETFPYITTENHAIQVIAWRLFTLKNVRLMLEFVGGYYLTSIEKGDIIRFTEATGVVYEQEDGGNINEGDDQLITQIGDHLIWHDVDKVSALHTLLEDAFLGLITLDNDLFRVIDVKPRMDGAMQVKAIKV